MDLARFVESRRLAAVQPPVIPLVAGLIRETPGTISLGQGVVYYGPPGEAMGRGVAEFAAQPDLNKYQAVEGIPVLREGLKRKLEEENGVMVGGDRVVMVTAGSNMAFMNALLAVADPGDEVILLSPYYFNHEMAIVMGGCRPVVVPTRGDLQPDVDRIRQAIGPRTRAVVTVSPNNPTGAVYPGEVLEEINRLCAERGVYHIHDEAYEYFVYEGAEHVSPARRPETTPHTISLFSLSKAYGFASWRIGYLLAPVTLLPALRKVQDTLLICAPVFSQWAAVAALEAGRGYSARFLPGLARVRSIFLEEARGLAGKCRVSFSQGAFYFWLELDSSQKPMAVVEYLVREHRVAVIPGDAFGVTDRCCLRVSYGALQPENAIEGVRRLVAGLRAVR